MASEIHKGRIPVGFRPARQSVKDPLGRLSRALTVLCAAGIVGACQISNIKDNSGLKQARSSGEASVVFGRLKWVENGTEVQLGKGMFGTFVVPELLRMDDNYRATGELDNNGYFAWQLPPGIYVMDTVTYRGHGRSYIIFPKAVFLVADKRKTYYVGTLRFEVSLKEGPFTPELGEVKSRVEDREQQDLAAIAKILEMAPSVDEKSLIIKVGGLPQNIRTMDDYYKAKELLKGFH